MGKPRQKELCCLPGIAQVMANWSWKPCGFNLVRRPCTVLPGDMRRGGEGERDQMGGQGGQHRPDAEWVGGPSFKGGLSWLVECVSVLSFCLCVSWRRG